MSQATLTGDECEYYGDLCSRPATRELTIGEVTVEACDACSAEHAAIEEETVNQYRRLTPSERWRRDDGEGR